MQEEKFRRLNFFSIVLLVPAAFVWLLWVSYAVAALKSDQIPVTWQLFALFLTGILVFLIPSLLIFFWKRPADSPARFHAGIWLIILGYYWIVAPLYQYLAINTNREMVLWYMIPYAWEVPVLGILYYVPLALWYRRGRGLNGLPLFAAFYFAFIAFVGYGPVGSFQFRAFGHAPWPEIIKNMVTGTIMGFVSGFLVYFYLNQILRHKIITIRRQLTAVAAALVVLAYVIYVPVSYRSAQELLAVEVGQNLIAKVTAGSTGTFMRRSDLALLQLEPEIVRELQTIIAPRYFYSHRDANRVVAAAPEGDFVRIYEQKESELQYLLIPFVTRGAIVGAVFGGIFALLMAFVIRLGEAYERRRNAELAEINSELHEKTLVVERVLADVKTVDEKLATLNRVKSEFISMASHQLRTPLTAIKWYAKLLKKDGLTALTQTQRRALHHMASANEKMIELVNDLLNVSRIEMGTLAMAREKIELKSFLKKMIDDVRPLAAERRVALRAVGSNVALETDKKLLEIIINNLLTNAIRYTPPRGTVKITALDKKKVVSVTVSDTGFGIPLEDQPRIFSKFFRASNIVSKVPEGTGLGLFITKSIAQKLGGDVRFTSTLNKGTNFIVTLPKYAKNSHRGGRRRAS